MTCVALRSIRRPLMTLPSACQRVRACSPRAVRAIPAERSAAPVPQVIRLVGLSWPGIARSGRSFLTPGGVYTEDVQDERLSGACHVFFARSPVAHARITRIDLSAVTAAPGVVAAFAGADLADLPEIRRAACPEMSRRVIATDTVRYVGEPVAIVVTEDPYQGEDALELVDVDYDQ